MKINEKQGFRGVEERVSGGQKECLSVSKEGLWGVKESVSGGKRESLWGLKRTSLGVNYI